MRSGDGLLLLLEPLQEARFDRSRFVHRELLDAGRLPAALLGDGLDHHAAADGARGRVGTDHEPVAARGDGGLLEPELGEGTRARAQRETGAADRRGTRDVGRRRAGTRARRRVGPMGRRSVGAASRRTRVAMGRGPCSSGRCIRRSRSSGVRGLLAAARLTLRSDLLALQQHEPSDDLARAQMKAHALVRRPRAGVVGQELEAHIEDAGRPERPGRHEPVAAHDRLALDAVNRDGGALAGARLIHRQAVHLHAPHARLAAGRQQRQAVAGADRAAPQRAGHDRAEPFHAEHAIDGQARRLRARPVRDRGELAVELGEQLARPVAGHGRELDDRGAGERRAGEQGLHVALRQVQPLALHQVALREHHDPARHAQQLDDREVLAGLRHHAFVGGDHEQHEVDAARPGEHVLHEPLVAGHIDDADSDPGRGHERGEAEIDRDPALLLFGQPIGIDPGEPAHERGLAVVDVAGGADHGQTFAEGGGSGAGGRGGHGTAHCSEPPAPGNPLSYARARTP